MSLDTSTERVADDIALDVTPLSATIGAEIRGVDLREPLDAATIAAIRKVWVERHVVFFPGQRLDPASHVRFGQQFGELTPAHPVLRGLRDHPEVFEIDYTVRNTSKHSSDRPRENKQGLGWHSDVTFVKAPPTGSILNAVTIPPSGGDTMFSDQQAAFEGLSPALQRFLETLTAEHDGRPSFQWALDRQTTAFEWDGEKYERLDPVEHPVVRTHPETGAKVLWVNPGFTTRITQLRRSESDALLAFLYEHATRPEYTVRYHWSSGDVGFWDNRATQHSVVGDYGEQPRVIHRVTLRGEPPVL